MQIVPKIYYVYKSCKDLSRKNTCLREEDASASNFDQRRGTGYGVCEEGFFFLLFLSNLGETD